MNTKRYPSLLRMKETQSKKNSTKQTGKGTRKDALIYAVGKV